MDVCVEPQEVWFCLFSLDVTHLTVNALYFDSITIS